MKKIRNITFEVDSFIEINNKFWKAGILIENEEQKSDRLRRVGVVIHVTRSFSTLVKYIGETSTEM